MHSLRAVRVAREAASAKSMSFITRSVLVGSTSS